MHHFRYSVSYLHQISLDFERSSTTSWAARMREASREALQVSSAAMTRILRDLLNHDAVKLLPFSAYVYFWVRFEEPGTVIHVSDTQLTTITRITMLFTPLTINSIFLKSSVQSSPRSVYDLSICFQALEILAQRHEIADFFWELNDASVMLVHEISAKEKLLRTSQWLADQRQNRTKARCDEQEKPPLPQTETYSSVLKFVRQSLVGGTVQWDLVTS